jgi:hypothetical protein
MYTVTLSDKRMYNAFLIQWIVESLYGAPNGANIPEDKLRNAEIF